MHFINRVSNLINSYSFVLGRGFLVTDYLKGDITCTDYIHNIVQAKESYQGFNFIAIEIDKE